MPRPKRATKPTNYSDEANSKEPEEVEVSSPPPKKKAEVEVEVDVQMEGVDQEPAQPSLPDLPNGPAEVVVPEVVTADEDATAGNDENEDDLPSTPPPRLPSRESTASANNDGEFHPQSDVEDVKPKFKPAASPTKRKATAPAGAGGSPTKARKGASPVKSEAGGNAKFESTPENRGAIIQVSSIGR